MNTRKIYLVCGAIMAITTILLVARHYIRKGRKTDEQKLMWIVDHMAESSEKKDIKEMRKWLSRNYLDARGRSYKEINKYLVYLYIRGGKFSAYVLSKDVSVDRSTKPSTAKMKVRAVLTRGPKLSKLTDIVPDAARAIEFDLEFTKEDEWRLTSARWKKLNNYQDFIN